MNRATLTLNPEFEHIAVYCTSAELALIRLQHIVLEDRKRFPVYEWKGVGFAAGMTIREAKRHIQHIRLGWPSIPKVFLRLYKPHFRHTRVR